jgi:hypothetical protein
VEDGIKLSLEQFINAVRKAESWHSLKAGEKNLAVVEGVATTAPKLMPVEQSLLHIWSGLEALFPSVSAELSFRLALYLAQLLSPNFERRCVYERVRASYSLRSAITHGSSRDISIEDWRQTWSLLMEAVNSTLARGHLPSGKELLEELLA